MNASRTLTEQLDLLCVCILLWDPGRRPVEGRHPSLRPVPVLTISSHPSTRSGVSLMAPPKPEERKTGRMVHWDAWSVSWDGNRPLLQVTEEWLSHNSSGL